MNEAETNLVQAQTDLVNAMINVYRAKAQLSAAVYGQIDTITVPADPENPDFMSEIKLENPADIDIAPSEWLQTVSNKTE